MAPMDTTIIGNGITETTGVNPAYLLAEVYDNGVDTVSALLTPNYYASMTSMPQLTFDYENKILYAVYSAISPGFVNADEENYRHIWFRFSDDYGVTWSPYQDLTGDIFHLFTECVYPSVSSNVTDKVHIIYQSDNYIGGSNRPDPPAHVHVDNDMVYLSVNTVVGINESQEQLLKVNQIFPNPANSIASITIHVDKPLTAEIGLLNILGQQVLQSTRNFGYVGEHLIQLKIDNLDAGIYFVKVQTGKQSVTKKIIIE
ncbi:MAG: hypothetical protein CVT92_11490 [Bacteroidetes bacterium HGW-Bacteroidetes-1]|jgi:hypothetical protein|nr:MAG: hypothetical protein CVT92_11490 [Bacteroidetes bacterium HGW-Bacteroidetes-1]